MKVRIVAKRLKAAGHWPDRGLSVRDVRRAAARLSWMKRRKGGYSFDEIARACAMAYVKAHNALREYSEAFR